MVRVVPPSVTHFAGDLDSSAVWNAGPVNSTSFLTGVPIFSGYATAVVSLVTATFTAIPLAATVIDSDNGHSNVTNNTRYTAQVSGWYMASGVVAFAAGATGDRQAIIRKNEGIVYGSSNAMPGNAVLPTVPTGTVLVQLNATDYIELVANQTSGGALNTSVGNAPEGCYLHVWWVGRT